MSLGRVCKWTGMLARKYSSSVFPSDPRAQLLLNNLAGLDVEKVLPRRKEPLVVPRYKLMTLDELDEAHKETVDQARSSIVPPPILPKRLPCEDILEVNENLTAALPHPIIFTDTSHHKDNQLRTIVVRDTDGVLRNATWEERDRMYQVFFPVHGRKMWLPKVLTDEMLTSALERKLHKEVLDLVGVQCDPQSEDYHRVHKQVYDDIQTGRDYNRLRSTPYFGCLVWHLLTAFESPCVSGLLEDMIQRKLFVNAAELIQLYMLCFPKDNITLKLAAGSTDLIKDFCIHSNLNYLVSNPESEVSVLQHHKM